MNKIIFIPTWKCNLRCSYCDYSTIDNQQDGYVLTAFDKEITIPKELTWDQWSKYLKRFDPFILEMTGGEPTLYKDLPRLLTSLPIDSKWAITSNTLLTETIKLVPGYNCHAWTASYHFHSDGIFLENVNTLTRKGINVRVTMVLTPFNLDMVKQKANMFSADGIGVNIHPMLKKGFSWDTHKDTWDEAKAMADEDPYMHFVDDIAPSWEAEKHPMCKAGTEDYFVLMPDGYVLRCYSDLLRYKTMAHISDFEPNEESMPCNEDCMFPCDKQIGRGSK